MKYIGFCLFATIALFACQAEIDPTITNEVNPDTSCKFSKLFIYNEFGVVDDSATAYYSGSNITGYKYGSGDSLSLSYNSAGNIIKRYLTSSSGDTYDTIFYNGNGTIAKTEYYDHSYLPGQVWIRHEFEYQSDKPVRVIQYLNDGSGNFFQYVETKFEYAGENISRRIDKIDMPVGGTEIDTFDFEYDNQPNLIMKIWDQPHLALPFQDLTSFISLQFNGANNMVKAVDPGDPMNPEIYTYQLNSHGYPVRIRINGAVVNELRFDCE
jgi:hypothetical protein